MTTGSEVLDDLAAQMVEDVGVRRKRLGITSPWSVDVGAVVNAYDVDHQFGLVQLVHDPVSASARGPQSG